MNGVSGYMCSYMGYIWSGEPDDGEMNEMALPSGHRIQKSSPGDPSTTRYLSVRDAPHNIESLPDIECDVQS